MAYLRSALAFHVLSSSAADCGSSLQIGFGVRELVLIIKRKKTQMLKRLDSQAIKTKTKTYNCRFETSNATLASKRDTTSRSKHTSRIGLVGATRVAQAWRWVAVKRLAAATRVAQAWRWLIDSLLQHRRLEQASRLSRIPCLAKVGFELALHHAIATAQQKSSSRTRSMNAVSLTLFVRTEVRLSML